MHWLTGMDWPTRLAWGLLAWPVMIVLAVLLSALVQPGTSHQSALVLLVGLVEVLAAFIAITFSTWSIITWFERGERPPEV